MQYWYEKTTQRNAEIQTREVNMSALNTANDKYDIKRIQNLKFTNRSHVDIWFFLLRVYANATNNDKCISLTCKI